MVVVLSNSDFKQVSYGWLKSAFQVSCGSGGEFCLINFEGVVLFFVDRVCVLVV